MNEKKQSVHYALFDALAAILAWTLYYLFRKFYIEPQTFGYYIPLELDPNYFLAIIILPVFWLLLFGLAGSYKKVHRKSRARELIKSFIVTFVGCVILFFTLLISDLVPSYEYYPLTFSALFLFKLGSFTLTRTAYLTYLKNRIKNREVGFNTLLIGEGKEAEKIFNEIEKQKVPQGYRFKGYLRVNGDANNLITGKLPELGNYKEVADLVDKHEIEDVIVAFDDIEQEKLEEIIRQLEIKKVNIKIAPKMYDFVTGKVKMDYIFGIPLIEHHSRLMPEWQVNLKRVMDVIASSLVLLFGAPFFAIIAIAIKSDSKGPVFYKQKRIGLYGKPFQIIKFRTMYVNAEKGRPMLSSEDDPRITRVGNFLRKYRLDEFPQFYNVLKGEMSLVGPRPERQFFIDQIMEVAPHYQHLWKTKPGITSWGQVKFGYAENVNEMVERLKFDILYIENMSLLMDMKILFYTVIIVFKGSGK